MPDGISLRWGTVTSELTGWDGVQELTLALDGGDVVRGLLYLDLLPSLAVGERALVNTTAEELALGSGGYGFVVAHERASGSLAGPGHLMKLRYTPFQLKVNGPEDPSDPRHAALQSASGLAGLPVVAVELHSQVAPVAAAFSGRWPEGRLAYVMTDAGALPYRFCRDAQRLRKSGLLAGVITAGQAFGGDLEAVNVHSALLIAARVLGADAAVVGIGPGILGSATPFGHGGVAQGEALNAVAALGGRPIACLRLSDADPRERHRGLSHHTKTVLETVALRPATAVLPPGASNAVREAVVRACRKGASHVVATEKPPPDWREGLSAAGVTLRSMGRGYAQDPVFFEAAAAAGSLAGRWAERGRGA